MTRAERDRAFLAERRRQWRRLIQEQRSSIGIVSDVLKAGSARLAEILAATPTEFQSWQMPQIKATIDAALNEVSKEIAAAASNGAGVAHAIGVSMLDEPLRAGGIRIAALLPDPDLRQLSAIRTFMTDRLSDVTREVAGKVNAQIGLVMVGAQTPGDAVSQVSRLVDGGRGRAITIVRTEMGRAFSVAQQERQAQASEYLPGLKKQWRRSGKRFSRIEHDLADGQIVDVDQPFIINGASLMFPRDPKGPPAETINCGCVSLPYMENWEVEYPDRTPFTDDETYADPRKRDLARELNPPAKVTPPGLAAIQRLDATPEQDARQMIARDLASDSFGEFARSPGRKSDSRAVAVLDNSLKNALSTKSQIVRLSSWTVVKQKDRRRGQEFAGADYQRIQKLLDEGTVLKDESGSLIAFGRQPGSNGEADRIWRAVLKPTKDRSEVYLQSLHRSTRRQMSRALRRNRLIKE